MAERELKAMARFKGHSNIVPIIEAGISLREEPYFVMPLLSGSLQDLLDTDGAMEWQDAGNAMVMVARAIGYGHDRGIFHRDIKPANILVDSEKQPRVADFGIAKFTDVTHKSSTGVAGTPSYGAPERYDGKKTTAQSDVYSLGATLAGLILGRPPFHTEGAESVFALLKQIADDPPPQLDIDGAPPELQELIDSSMAKDPSDRPATAYEFADQLSSVIGLSSPDNAAVTINVPEQEFLIPPAAPHASRLGRITKRTRVLVGAALGLLLLPALWFGVVRNMSDGGDGLVGTVITNPVGQSDGDLVSAEDDESETDAVSADDVEPAVDDPGANDDNDEATVDDDATPDAVSTPSAQRTVAAQGQQGSDSADRSDDQATTRERQGDSRGTTGSGTTVSEAATSSPEPTRSAAAPAATVAPAAVTAPTVPATAVPLPTAVPTAVPLPTAVPTAVPLPTVVPTAVPFCPSGFDGPFNNQCTRNVTAIAAQGSSTSTCSAGVLVNGQCLITANATAGALSCPSGSTLDGANCVQLTPATATSNGCAGGYIAFGQVCKVNNTGSTAAAMNSFTCPAAPGTVTTNMHTIGGTTKIESCSYTPATSPTCSSGTLHSDGSNCVTATANPTQESTCAAGFTLTGSVCERFESPTITTGPDSYSCPLGSSGNPTAANPVCLETTPAIS